MTGLTRTRRSAPGRATAAATDAGSFAASSVRPGVTPCRRQGPTP